VADHLREEEEIMSQTASEPIHPTWAFTLILDGVPELTDDMTDALYEAGCDDALVGSRDGVIFLDFTRQAVSLQEAVRSAISDVQAAGVSTKVVCTTTHESSGC
jgi:hypothetical protein